MHQAIILTSSGHPHTKAGELVDRDLTIERAWRALRTTSGLHPHYVVYALLGPESEVYTRVADLHDLAMRSHNDPDAALLAALRDLMAFVRGTPEPGTDPT